jgi:hypothetical protein
VLGLQVGLRDPIEGQLNQLLAKLFGEFPCGRQPRMEPGAYRVVTTSDTDVVGNPSATVSKRLVYPVSRLIVAGKNGGNGFLICQQRFCAQVSALGIVF